ncbi:MAG: glycosyltransferase [Verrucomicrobiaceae bacterium]|nr:glycosyltransferase [Verrucomicrobiaceae bacterium]
MGHSSTLVTPNSPSPRLRVLWIKSGGVYPPNTGGRLRTYEMLKALHADHDVHFLALGSPENGDRCDYASKIEFIPLEVPHRRSVAFMWRAIANLFSPNPLSLDLYRSTALGHRVEQICRRDDPDLIICDFLTPALSLPLAVRKRAILFQHNIEALIWKRTAETARSWFAKMYFSSQYRRMHRLEGRLSKDFARVITVSAADSELAAREYGLNNIVGHVATGVSESAFAGIWEKPKQPGQVCFLGSMDWMPNIDGMAWFLEEVWPSISTGHPEASLRVIGRNPPPSLVQRASGAPSVCFTGTVDDIRPHLEDVQIAVVPLRIGGGTRLKILELMAAGIPIVSTTIGAEGLPVQHGVHLLLADTPDEMRAAVLKLMGDAGLRSRLREAAQKEIVRPAGWSAVTRDFVRLATNPLQSGSH